MQLHSISTALSVLLVSLAVLRAYGRHIEPCRASVYSTIRGGGDANSAIRDQMSSTQEESQYDFEKMSSFVRRLDVLEASAADTLTGFYDPRLRSFSIKPGSAAGSRQKRVCVTSTCYALLTLALSSPGVYDSILAPNDAKGGGAGDEMNAGKKSSKVCMKQVLRTLLASAVRQDDMFQVPLLLYTLLRVDTDRSVIRSAVAKTDDEVASKMRQLLSAVLKARPERQLGARQVHSDYIGYQVCKVLALLYRPQDVQIPALPPSTTGNNESNQEVEGEGELGTSPDKAASEVIGAGGLPANALPRDAEAEIFWALLSCAKVSWDNMCRQLAFRAAGDSSSFDAVRLAYSLLTYIRSTESLSDMAGRELVAGEGPAQETRVAPLNKKMTAAALSAFFREQNSNGLWDKGQPIYKSFREGKGRDMGGAFVFPVNTLGSLLCGLPAEAFRSHLGSLERTLEWIESHQTLEMITDRCDPQTGQCYGKPLRGWSSPHHGPDSGPQAWPTAQVLKCVSWMSRTIRQLMHNDVLEEFKGVAFSKKGIKPESWDRLLDTDLGAPCKEGCRTTKSVLEERVINPFSKSIDNPSYGAAYSAILFGPPGTAKTTICEALAQRMGYDFLVIDTAAFLADGLTNVASRIRYIFSRLMALDKCVILFDEIEEFALDREAPGLSMESRMLTTSMLTAINDLRRTKKSIFFIATNRLRAFDSAITRPGRFDMQLFVGTPNLESRVEQFKQKLAAGGAIQEDERSKAITTYRSFLESVWTDDAMYMNYLEGMQFASACADMVLSGEELSKREMTAILKQQAAVMTVRGAAREEFIASMELSRL
uniref:AAA+ ATPase domain-containing protein n=1 Tax=Odontella aurita TaxID=265563 RepID=A0A7S4K6L8_9STRA|mmetsp:Transcript_62917/g.185826  ORF Transcript_62917/g.185826 Transcript_62917/m.185826 type:complete len:825 (+) Transcript_62917:269-2743(+)|eukprot:CAMPEP_0113544328 /NCGR_PEP_ID=MMETSP0015_2-20120614/10647_1 /TAXON_ID=2838 /ORGANISM="Odontella" /LENGTH=824 /DNA_ID=CAMNT_0000444575 /DNA_START=711 /DNA_END=3185 /DNA_ORIENTATION=- /assembly_acc=CAM_ASM_000160